ncbi:AraC family transcriptional regulator [Iamia sp. SCSIO 61187]|uniref:AraC family transcriptional regulator n=1 Tax=Iamia sp. SCSIO 61187 TaxID=2722752 RepID=UPI001C630633|nr:AraC family transcriptional regulator [Iamia sp. SCSIO 61187]QYG95041.1 AraC family transcriptional regulator [Iamia sp. SCSIO 61187]
MDVLASLLEHVRADRALFSQATLDPTWAVDLTSDAPLVLIVVAQGEVSVHAGGLTETLRAGDAAVLAGDRRLAVGGAADARPRPAPEGASVAWPDLASRLQPCTGDPEGPAVLVVGAYHVVGPTSARLVAALPPIAVVRDEGDLCPPMDLLYAELGRDKPGQSAVLDRVLDLLLITTLREWFDRSDVDPPAWCQALGDPVIGPALRALEARPAHPWTVARLAAEVGVSRATLARRFTALVGEPPMGYLTRWRLTRAVDLLRRTDASVDAIARQVGYESGDALAVAVKRVYGVRPGAFRTRTAA